MYFDFKTYFRFFYLTFFRAKDSHYRLTPRRAGWLLAFFIFFPLFELFNALCMLLDHVFFPGFRRVTLDKALFIVGPHRSGTTYLQRLLDRDADQFFALRLWEIVFPSILQKKGIALIGRLDRRLGGHIAAAIRRRENRRLGDHYQQRIHETSFFEPEEDDKLTAHTFSTLALLWFAFANAEELDWLLFFDEKASEKDKDRIMGFYRACLKRQAYFRGNRILCSKAPFASLRVKSIYRYFPGCRVIYTVRNPLAAVPSMLDIARLIMRAAGNLENWEAHQGWLYGMIREMYRYPLAVLDQADPASCQVIVHDDLLKRPRETIRDFYAKFGYVLSPAFDELLKKEDEKQRRFSSRHSCDMKEFGLTPEKIKADFDFVFDRYRFG